MRIPASTLRLIRFARQGDPDTFVRILADAAPDHRLLLRSRREVAMPTTALLGHLILCQWFC